MAVHIPVLLNEILENLAPSPGAKFIDCTAGEGGHTLAFAKMVAPGGEVLAIEADPEQLEILTDNIADAGVEEIITTAHGNYAQIKDIADANNFISAQGILFDLGFSSRQLEKSRRGFSFQRNELLDMRFNPQDDTLPTAAYILNNYSRDHLIRIFKDYGEEFRATAAANAIVGARKREEIRTTGDLVNILSRAMPARGRINPATKIFQALRIAVNHELDNLEKGLEGALEVVGPSGRIAVISFHSLEDRIIKLMFKKWAAENRGKLVNKKVIKPHYREVRENRRARSAKLRIFEIV